MKKRFLPLKNDENKETPTANLINNDRVTPF